MREYTFSWCLSGKICKEAELLLHFQLFSQIAMIQEYAME